MAICAAWMRLASSGLLKKEVRCLARLRRVGPVLQGMAFPLYLSNGCGFGVRDGPLNIRKIECCRSMYP